MAKSQEEIAEDLKKEYEDRAQEQRDVAGKLREEEGTHVESDEEYEERVRLVRNSQQFSDSRFATPADLADAVDESDENEDLLVEAEQRNVELQTGQVAAAEETGDHTPSQEAREEREAEEDESNDSEENDSEDESDDDEDNEDESKKEENSIF